MSDDLVISGGGSTSVAVDTLLVDASRLGSAEATAQDWIDRFAAVRASLEGIDGPSGSALEQGSSALTLMFAGNTLADAHEQIGDLHRHLVESAERYGATERFIGALWDLGGRLGAAALGSATPLLAAGALRTAVTALPLVLPTIAALAAARAFGLEPKPTALAVPLQQWFADHRELLGDPVFVRLVRTVADHADDLVLAALLGPTLLPLAAALEAPESASALLASAGGAAALGIGGGRTLVDRAVRVEQVDPGGRPTDATAPAESRVPPPDGLGALADRIPPSDGAAQITVERYRVEGEDRWIVYVGGTVDFTIEGDREPFDMTSNVHGIADDSVLDAVRPTGWSSAGAERAVRQALAEAGAAPDDPVITVGHSGGGVIAARLAGDPAVNVVAGVNLGGPVASAPIPHEVPFLSVEHEDDLVPATGGSGRGGSEMLVVSRRAVEPGAGGEAALPAHELTRYRETADLLDRSEAEPVVEFRERIARFTGDAPGERSRWRASRE